MIAGADTRTFEIVWRQSERDRTVAYRFKLSDGSVATGLRRMAVEQIDRAIAEIDDGELDAHETVHQVRKRCKKLRGLIRLVRPVFHGYRAENRNFRNAANELSNIRDSQAVIEAYDVLADRYADLGDNSAFSSIRCRLARHRREAREDGDLEDKLSEFRITMIDSRRRAENWTIEGEGFDALAGGLAKTYKRARKAMERAERDPTAVKLHGWRKRIKYHWYHARLVRGMWPELIGAHRDAAKELAELLGDHHDLAVLRDTLREESAGFGTPADLEAFVDLIARRQAVLESRSFALGRKLLAEKRSALLHRWGVYWTVWDSEKSEGGGSRSVSMA